MVEEHSRKNLQDAFVGEADPLSEGADADPNAPEAVEFRVVSGTLRTQVASGTGTQNVLGGDQFYEADLVLEDGTSVTITISQGASGVDVLVNAQSEPGLSGIESSDAETR